MLCLLAGELLAGQAPRISVIDFYGLERLSETAARKALAVKEGDPLPPSKAAAEERLEQLEAVVLAHLEAVCCEGDGAILFVGIQEKGAPSFSPRTGPASSAVLAEEVVKAHAGFLELYGKGAGPGETRQSLAPGYTLSSDPRLRAAEERIAEVAGQQFVHLRHVLRESSEPEHRAVAAFMIGYAPDRQAAAEALQYALQDPEPAVRHSALRALKSIAVFAAGNPAAGIRISPTWPVELLKSVVWGDRTRAADLLVTLTESRDERTLNQIRESALAPVADMARWKSLTYALPAYILFGRMAGLAEDAIQETWSKGEREKVMAEHVPRLRRRD